MRAHLHGEGQRRTTRPATIESRPEYIREGDTLVVWKLDRLARLLPQLIATVAELEAPGIGLRSLTEQIHTTTAGERLVLHIFGALAEFERAVIRERTSAGLAAAKARGKKDGRPASMKPKDIAAAKAMLTNPDLTVEDIAKRLNASPATLYRHVLGGRSSLQASTQ